MLIQEKTEAEELQEMMHNFKVFVKLELWRKWKIISVV